MGNRLFYSCLGVGLSTPNVFPSNILTGVQSVAITSSNSIEYFLIAKNTEVNPSNGSFQATTDVTFDYSQIVTSFEDLSTAIGSNSYGDLYMFTGEDTEAELDPVRYILCRYVLLESISYNISVDSFFEQSKSFKGFSRYICPFGSFPVGIPGEPTDTDPDCILPSVLKREHFNITGSNLPSIVNSNALQTIQITQSINRTNINEPGTKTPYGSAVNFPIETDITLELISRNLDGNTQPFQTNSCLGNSFATTDMEIVICNSVCENKFNISEAAFTNIVYGGGDVGGGNQTITIEYTSYEPLGINPLIEFPSNATAGCP